MDELTSVWFNGVGHGALATLFILFGLIGWPSTRFILGQIASTFTRRKPRKPVGSRLWEKYNAPVRTRYKL